MIYSDHNMIKIVMKWMEQYNSSETSKSKIRKKIMCKQSYANYKNKISAREISNIWNQGKGLHVGKRTNGARRL